LPWLNLTEATLNSVNRTETVDRGCSADRPPSG